MATIEQFLAAAASEIGYTENPAGSNRTKFAAEAGYVDGRAWCATFVAAIAKRVGLALPSTSAYTPSMADGFRAAGQWDTTSPQAGDLAFFDFPDSVHRIQHVGIVEQVRSDGSLTTIEGNTSSGVTGSQDNGGGVWRRHRAKGLAVGFGRPTFEPSTPPSPPAVTPPAPSTSPAPSPPAITSNRPSRTQPMIFNIKDSPYFFFVRGVASDDTLVLVALEQAEAWELAAAGVPNIVVSSATFDKVRKAPAWDRTP